jgi:hypothetical protein
MSERHPAEIELAQFSESENGVGLEHHVRRCSRCRRVLADYGWLQGEVATVLDARANAVAVPQPSWQTVRERVRRAERRSEVGKLLAAVGVAVVVCLMLGAPSVLSRTAEAQAVPVSEVVTAPPPVRADDLFTGARWGATGTVTSTPARSREGTEILLPFAPPPTPPALET